MASSSLCLRCSSQLANCTSCVARAWARGRGRCSGDAVEMEMEMRWRCDGGVVQMQWRCGGDAVEMRWRCREMRCEEMQGDARRCGEMRGAEGLHVEGGDLLPHPRLASQSLT